MTLTIRRSTPADAAPCGRILFAAFEGIARAHGFPPDFPSTDEATGVASTLMDHPAFHDVVADHDGEVVGSNFIDLRSSVGGIGPVSVDPARQNAGIGARLMRAVMDEADRRGAMGARLVQMAYHNRSLCLYSRLGFVTREPLSILQGPAIGQRFAGYDVRPMVEADLGTCIDLCRRVHGVAREAELRETLPTGAGQVVEHMGRVTGYTTGIGFLSHTVAEANRDVMALIGAAPAFSGMGFLLPTRNHDVLVWCLRQGLRLVAQGHLMSVGMYGEPRGAWLPSVLY